MKLLKKILLGLTLFVFVSNKNLLGSEIPASSPVSGRSSAFSQPITLRIETEDLLDDDPLFGDSPDLRFDLAKEQAEEFFKKRVEKTIEPVGKASGRPPLTSDKYDEADVSQGRFFGLFRDNSNSSFSWN